ncbi:ubiquitin--protein ligase [Necator americanus]|uniref:Ubiquitin--protein ligase n=1 Tax=Necator americanus TaxID=51031 RepID=W2TCZ8_NECAM|nr:ubiquitin--protein ligase [Necator americanus]ETN78872.1 ubiquitin--protein ligase [Necator americanus]
MSLDASSRRLMKELQQLSTEPPTGIVVNKDAASSDLKQWRVDVIGAAGTLYEGEKFSLQFRFTQQYPFNSPELLLLFFVVDVFHSVLDVCRIPAEMTFCRSGRLIMLFMFEHAIKIPVKLDGGSTMIPFNSDIAYVILAAMLILFTNVLPPTTNIKACDCMDIVRNNTISLSNVPRNR